MQICLSCGAEVSSAQQCAVCGAIVGTYRPPHPLVCGSDASTPNATPDSALPLPDKLIRLRDGRKIAGVCAGLAARYGWPVTLIRVLFIVPGIFWLVGPTAYLILCLKLDKWPPASPVNPSIVIKDRSSELRVAQSRTKKRKKLMWLVLGSGIITTILGGVLDQNRLMMGGLLILLIVTPTCWVAAFVQLVQVSKMSTAERKRLELEKTVKRICSRCNGLISAGSSSCPFCGSNDLFYDTISSTRNSKGGRRFTVSEIKVTQPERE